MAKWFREVTGSISKVPDCVLYFEAELDAARKELSLKGKTLERHGAELPGIFENRFSQLQEIEAILEHLNILLRQKRGEVFKKFLENYARSLSSRDCEKYVDFDPDVVQLSMLCNEFALLRNQYLSLIKGLDNKQWQLTNIVKLRVAGLEDATVD